MLIVTFEIFHLGSWRLVHRGIDFNYPFSGLMQKALFFLLYVTLPVFPATGAGIQGTAFLFVTLSHTTGFLLFVIPCPMNLTDFLAVAVGSKQKVEIPFKGIRHLDGRHANCLVLHLVQIDLMNNPRSIFAQPLRLFRYVTPESFKV
jgi:hypothetical protein